MSKEVVELFIQFSMSTFHSNVGEAFTIKTIPLEEAMKFKVELNNLIEKYQTKEIK